ncbi:MAG: DUF697 domain-containing protein [Planctomycetota bacterium]
MARPQSTFTIVAVVAVAVVGYLLVSFAPSTLSQFDALSARSPALGYAYLASVGVGVLLLGGIGCWGLYRVWGNTLARRRSDARRGRNPSQLSEAERRAELAENLASGRGFAAGIANKPALRAEIERLAADLEAKREAHRLEVVAFGAISSGKSSLLNALAGREVFESNVVGGTTTTRSTIPWQAALSDKSGDHVTLVDTPGLAEVEGQSRAAEAAAHAENADLVLFVVDGPLKSYESDLLTLLGTMEKRVVLCLNKEDWYDARQRSDLLAQLGKQSAGTVKPEDLVAVRSRPVVREQVRVLADGREETVEVTDPPDITPLADRLIAIVRREGGDLLLANLLMQSRGLIDDAKQKVLAALDDEADRVIDRYMWAAGGAGAIPLPFVDIAGGAAVTVKMVLDLAAVYKQKIDADTVVELLSQLSKNLIAMLGVSAAGPALLAALGSVLKLAPGVGTIPGSLLQGVVQALMTRWIGRVFCRYYREGMKPPEGGLAELAKREWDLVTSADELRKLVRLGRERLGGKDQNDGEVE